MSAFILIFLGFPINSFCFYLPGLAPIEYCQNCQDTVAVYVNRLNSLHTIIPYEYERFDLCQPAGGDASLTLNLGQILFGDRIRLNTLYKLKTISDSHCCELCTKAYQPNDQSSSEKFNFLKQGIKNGYVQHLIVDNMPATLCYNTVGDEIYCQDGFPLGCHVPADGQRTDHCAFLQTGRLTNDTYYIFNHVDIMISYRANEDSQTLRIIAVKVYPRSFLDMKNCKMDMGNALMLPREALTEAFNITFTYSLTWKVDTRAEWSNRWDYILEQSPHGCIHWFSIINSFLVRVLIGIVLKSLKNDIALSNELKNSEDCLGKYDKWRLLHGDVFRPPRCGMVLSALAGSGIQVLFMTMVTIQLAALGMLSPATRGGLGTCALIVFAYAGFPAGVASSRVYKRFGGEKWITNAMVTALLFPGLMFAVYLILNLIYWGQGSSAAIPATTLLALVGLWIGASLLMFLGAFLGQRKGEKLSRSAFSEIPRPIPVRSFFCKIIPGMFIGGILPFGCVYMENFFVMNSIWQHQVYYSYGTLLFVFVLLLITTAESTIMLCYFHLNAQDYNWWWRSFLTGGFSAVYFFIYAIYYYVNNIDFHGMSGILYFLWTLMIAFGFFLLTGSVGFFACFWFVKRIYSSVK